MVTLALLLRPSTTPLDQSVLTGQTPITLVPGITLTSGVLRYRGANDLRV